jgi:hypothetical protein
MLSDIKTATAVADATMVSGRTRVKAVHICNDATTAGTCVLNDGGSGGTALVTLSTNISDSDTVIFPEAGVVFETDVYLDMTNLTRVTIFYA